MRSVDIQSLGDVADQLHYAPAADVPDDRSRRWMERHAHRHSYAEVAVCLEGKHRYGVGGRVVRAKPGFFWVIPGGVPHDDWYGPMHEPCRDLWIHLLPGGAARCNGVDHVPGCALVMTPLPWPADPLRESAAHAWTLINGESAAHERLSTKATHFLCYLLCHFFELRTRPDAGASVPESAEVANQVARYIEENLTDDLRLKDLAKLAGYSPFHFHRLFTMARGVTPRQYVEDCRLRHALRRLETGHSVTAAGMDSGFSTPGEFSRVFHRATGCSPTKWLCVRSQELRYRRKNGKDSPRAGE